MLLLPEVSKTFADSLPLGVREHAKILPVLLKCISAKKSRGESPSDLWLLLVRKEIIWCVDNSDKLTWRHRLNACDLLEWYYSVTGEVDDAWLILLPESEYYWRFARAELDWCAAHVSELSPRERDFAVDLYEDFYSANPENFRPAWSVILSA